MRALPCIFRLLGFLVAATALTVSADDAADRVRQLQEALAALPEPVAVFRPGPGDFRAGGPAGGLTVREVAVAGQSFDRALEVRTLQESQESWHFQAYTPIPLGVKKGDALLAVFRLRNPQAADGADAHTEVVIEQTGEPYVKSLLRSLNTGREWTLHYLPLEAAADYAPGTLNLLFRAGYGPQTFELADFQLLHFGDPVKLGDLPRVAVRYAGMEADAPWRAEAAARISRIRQADLTVQVLDADGRPLPDAEVRIEMKRHAFRFGSAVILQWIADPAREAYRQRILELFNHVTAENDLKWPPWENLPRGRYSREKTLEGLRWLKAREIQVKGHCLVWPSWRMIPPRLRALRDDPAALGRAVDEHIRDLVSTVGQWVDEWDVINEPYNNHDLMQVLGNDAMIRWFQKTREFDADARLYLNEFGILAAGGRTDTAQQAHFERSLRFLIDGGAPLGGIGVQSHFDENLTPPETLWKILDRFAAFGLPIQITEFDVNTRDEALQAAYQRDFMTAIFAHPAVNGFVMWGFQEDAHWRPDAAMFRRDGSAKPNGEIYRKLVFGDWWTRELRKTDTNGRVQIRGFQGRYLITVRRSERELSQTLDLPPAGAELILRLE